MVKLMQSKAKTVEAYLAELPADRRAAIAAIRDVVRKNLSPEIQECMGYGMIGWSVPHSVFPAGYHCDPKQPLPYAALAGQKDYISLYMMGFYVGCVPGQDSPDLKWFREAWAKSGKKPIDMGRSCIRVKRLEDLPLDVIGEAIRRVPAKVYIQRYEAALAGEKKRKAARKVEKGGAGGKKKVGKKKAVKKKVRKK